ncbi:hypothetical protein OIU76_006736 [Salix suchowensis]|nr:hypothetical protein OIU78_012717 [Salix suchowensis]KAJ6336926.1 hypothetical protein OIU76_006736 [Salix suchowensis]
MKKTSTLALQKTTSGKLQRWAAKDRLIRGKMSVIMEMQMGDENARLLSSPAIVTGEANKERGQGRSRAVAEGSDREISLAFSSTRSRPSLLSPL